MLEVLGKGGFGLVQKSYNKKLGKYIALKYFINNEEEDEQEQIEQIQFEDHLLKAIENISENSKNIHFLRYYGVFENLDSKKPESSSLILQMESGISTLDDILRAGKVYSYPELLYIIRLLIKGFSILQQNCIAQRDVKTENIILVENGNIENQFHYKISDFGIGCLMQKGVKTISCQTLTGMTPKYAAPEVLSLFEKIERDSEWNEEYNPFLADVYSLGIVALKMMKYTYGIKDLDSGLLGKKELFKDYEPLLKLVEKMLGRTLENRMDFIELEIFMESDESFKFETPLEEFKYYKIWKETQEKKKGLTLNGVLSLYEEHKELYGQYSENLSRLNQAKYHIERAYIFFKELKEIVKIEEEIYLLNEFANIHIKLRAFDQADENLKESIEICKKVYKSNENHHYFAMTYHFLSIWNWENENLTQAEEYGMKALKILKTLYGELHYGTALLYNDLGILCVKKEELKEAEEFFIKSLNIRQTINNEDHFSIIQSYNNLGMINKRLNNQLKAEEYYMKSLTMALNLYGESHFIVGTSSLNLAVFYEEIQEVLKAEKFYKESLKINKNIYGEINENTANSYKFLGIFYQEIMKDFVKAEENLEKAEEIEDNLADIDLNNVLKIKHKKKVPLIPKKNKLISYDSCCYQLKE